MMYILSYLLTSKDVPFQYATNKHSTTVDAFKQTESSPA